ncbi:MAG TPA: HNH endonuclease [Thiobacillaceae bacterium]|nr:HNH endonuclease [Thiobacillaceae bacterium]
MGAAAEGKVLEMTRTQILDAFDRIRVWQQGDKRAPHKPLLVLLALGRLQRGEPGTIEFSQIDAPLKALIDEFGPSGAGRNRQLPFWHLATDDNGGLWQLTGPASILQRARGATPTLTELREHHISGGFAPAIINALRNDPGLIQEVARRILDAHFPETLHADILATVGLNLAETRKARSEESEYNRRNRDPGFRERILRAYEYRCCVCGYDLRLGQQSIGLEAAHIKWFQAGGPDVESNGLAMCALHHKIFDLGAFTVHASTYRIEFSRHVIGHNVTGQTLLSKHGSEILPPQSRDYLPDADFLGWHHEQVFKKPAREL